MNANSSPADNAKVTQSSLSPTSLSGATLRTDLQTLKDDLDVLLAHAAELTDVELNEAHERILTKFSSLRHAAKGIAAQASRQFDHGVEATTDYVRGKPVQSIALAIGFGALLGIIIGRR